MSDTISTSALAKSLGISSKELFHILESKGYICRKDDQWQLLPAGENAGGQYIQHPKYGQYIGWPSDLRIDSANDTQSSAGADQTLSATAIGKLYNLSANRMNSIFSELGWIEKSLKGWNLTASGNKAGGEQREDYRSGIPYVVWPAAIIDNKAFKSTIGEVQGEIESVEAQQTNDGGTTGFRDKFEAKLRTTDGHYVRSKAEMLIDNWLYMAEIVHAYERKLPIEEEVYCDFYIPTGKVYIEYWGYENDPKYLARKQQKQDIYKRYGFKLIELEDKDVQNLDDVLPRMLLKHGVQSY
ncbi:hypothetical protein ADIMK_3120 [Marinobacterium lacunae]|uniref:Uncharacterized protein n=1 Tax=Marinobacterium lacunae TaxID=1232683 RepID=A0A081FVU3_9GAMM|nr:phage antirepressor KilAC domain-containing protein [Marinobacterium lacunae]KEA62648.1 hypothetical protein ADIMK_3120 [Marinobacterium lacunae]